VSNVRRALAGAAICMAGLATAGCGSKADDFYDEIYTCGVSATQDECGTTRDGKPMTCYAASPLGGADFCAPACDVNATSPGGTVCVGGGARLETCSPLASAADPQYGCPTGLNCYRTDLIRDEGLCLNIPVCNVSTDCAGEKRRLCASELVRATFPDVPLPTNNLHCLQAGCMKTGTECPSGESCLPVALPVSAVPDICVPNCDANLRCPPNFVCSNAVSGPVAPKVCIPGLPGQRCAGPQDCLVGDCEDSGAGFSLCATPCNTHEDCKVLISIREEFVCAHRPSDGVGHCVSPSPFAGSPCLLPTDCAPGFDCYMYSPYQTMPIGECRVPCGPSNECEARGGVPHVCLADGAGGCFPGRFGLPCADSSQCMAGYVCETVTNQIAAGGPITQAVCTVPCATDADCDANPWTTKAGYCDGGYCQLGAGKGEHCARNAQCRTRRCQLPPAGNGTCLDRTDP
jgi:hypothetical protein